MVRGPRAGHADALLATTVYAILDHRTGAVEWSDAGHPPPVVVGPDGAGFLDDVHGPPLGADPTTTYATTSRTVAGEALLLYTDGLIEHRHRSIVEGLAVLLDVAGAAWSGDVEAFCGEVAQRALVPERREDDMCLLVAGHGRG